MYIYIERERERFRWCWKCGRYGYLRKNGCANPRCSLYYVRDDWIPNKRGTMGDKRWTASEFLNAYHKVRHSRN